MALFVAKVRPFILFDCLRGLSFNPLFILHPQYRYQRLNVQQTKTVPVERHAYRRNVRIPVRPYRHVLPMLSAQFITPFPWEQCLAPVCQVLLAKAMSAVKKYVSNSKEFYEKRQYFELIFFRWIYLWLWRLVAMQMWIYNCLYKLKWISKDSIIDDMEFTTTLCIFSYLECKRFPQFITA